MGGGSLKTEFLDTFARNTQSATTSFGAKTLLKFGPYSEFSHDYNEYHPLEEIYVWMDEIARSHEQRVELGSIGTTNNDHEIKILKIQPGSGQAGKTVVVDCGIHAREWIAPAFCQYLTNYLLTSSDSRIQNISNNLNWHIIPVLNPDGYEYSWTTNRSWRKNRARYGTCTGVDLNRNFNSNWGGPGSSGTCTSTYRGPDVCSENECRALVNYFESLQNGEKFSADNQIQMYLTFHSFGQYVLFPYGKDYTSKAENYSELKLLANQTAEAIQKLNGKFYINGQTTETLYPAAGGSDDWAMEHGGLNLSFTFEMRDKGEYGFRLPIDQIQPACEEVMEGVIVMADHLIARLEN